MMSMTVLMKERYIRLKRSGLRIICVDYLLAARLPMRITALSNLVNAGDIVKAKNKKTILLQAGGIR